MPGLDLPPWAADELLMDMIENRSKRIGKLLKEEPIDAKKIRDEMEERLELFKIFDRDK